MGNICLNEKKRSKPGECNIAHVIELNENENVYIADRENRKFQTNYSKYF